MGDRVYMQVWTLPQYVHYFTGTEVDEESGTEMPCGCEREASLTEVEVEGNGLVRLEDDQANYGNNTCMNDLADKGVPFLYEHTDGCEFGAMVGACDGCSFAECDSDHNGQPSVAYEENGVPMKGALEAMAGYVIVLKR